MFSIFFVNLHLWAAQITHQKCTAKLEGSYLSCVYVKKNYIGKKQS